MLAKGGMRNGRIMRHIARFESSLLSNVVGYSGKKGTVYKQGRGIVSTDGGNRVSLMLKIEKFHPTYIYDESDRAILAYIKNEIDQTNQFHGSYIISQFVSNYSFVTF